jgi:hypothetical protein
MVPIPADPQRDLEDEFIAVLMKASSTSIARWRGFYSLSVSSLIGWPQSNRIPDDRRGAHL